MKAIQNKKVSVLFLSLFCYSAALSAQPQETWVTIFVHGIISLRPHLSLSNVVKLVRDKIADSVYARAVEKIRKDPFFFQYHAMQEMGLKKIDLNDKRPGAGASAFAHLYDDIERLAQHHDCNIQNEYYTFGWSGLLSPKIRYLESKIFFEELVELIKSYHRDDIYPHIRIVGYSHGGNIALSLGEIYLNEPQKHDDLFVDELVLIGVPVIPDNDYCITSPLFGKIYHFYSLGDRIQPLDCFAVNRFFSGRTFKTRIHKRAPEKLVQIRIGIKRFAYKNRDPLCGNKNLYKTLTRKAMQRTADPGHSELWSFGWTAGSFRKLFPLNPLPFSIFIPYIIDTVNHYEPCETQVTVELFPEYEYMMVRGHQTKSKHIAPFLSEQEIKQLKECALDYTPRHFTKQLFDQRVNYAISEAQREKAHEAYIKKLRHKANHLGRRGRKLPPKHQKILDAHLLGA